MVLTIAAALGAPVWDAEDLVRVDVPDYPNAVVRSATGALVVGEPSDVSWRPEAMAFTDDVVPDEEESPFPAALALEAMGVPAWHDAGATGAGVKVAVFDSKWFGGSTDTREVGEYTTHDCLASTTCSRGFDLDGPAYRLESGQHGWACAEVVRDVAPDAEVFLVRVTGYTTFENAVAWAIRSDIDVITMSLSFYNESFTDGTGPYSDLLAELDAAGIVLVTSAGNTALQHWSSDWRDGDGDGVLDGPTDGRLLWNAPAGASSANINWNQFDHCGATDLSVRAVDVRGWVAAEANRNQVLGEAGCRPTERLRVTLAEATTLAIEIVHEDGPLTGLVVDVLARDGGLVDPDPRRSLTDPGANSVAFTVGAVRASEYWDASVESFSSWGPNHAGQPGIDIAGPDGLSTSAYGPIGFFGTSASTPAVAGLLAVVMSDAPGRTPKQAATLVRGWALRGDSGDFDPRWGAGKAHLPRPDPSLAPCGQRPLLMGLFLPLLPWWRRLRQDGARRGQKHC